MKLKKTEKLFRKITLVILCAAFLGGLVAFAIAVKDYMRSGDNTGKIEVESPYVIMKNGVWNGTEYRMNQDEAEIILEFPEKMYITKLQYEYKIQEPINEDISVQVYFENLYGEQEVKEITDNYSMYASRSVLVIKENVEKIVIKFPEMGKDIVVNNFIIDNSFKFNPLVAAFAAISMFVLLFIVLFREENSDHPEVVTFVVIMSLASLLLILQPPYCVGWDEQIHFENSYNLAVVPRDNGTPNVVRYISDATNGVGGPLRCDSIEERMDLIRIMNQKGEEYGFPVPDNGIQMSSVGYVLSAVFITISRFLRVPFYVVWLAGKFANVLLYAFGISVAIAIVPIGKRLLSVISLLPTMVFLSGLYTYDVTVNVFIILSICIWIKEIVEIDRVFTIKWRIFYLLCMVIGCIPKAVYIPLLLCAFFMPSSKFYSLKDRRIFRLCTIGCCFVLAGSFVLPTILTPESLGGDIRVSDASVAGQLNYILAMPFSYLKILWENITNNLVIMVSGEWLTTFAYVGTVIYTEPYVALLVGTAITDTYQKENSRGDFCIKYKAISLISIIGVVVLIWTALYLSFTPVGKTMIDGVQGRYYFPFIFLIYLCLRNRKIKNTFSVKNYQMSIMLIASVLLIYSIYSMFLVKFCL